jgi:hypothetical protein
VAAASEFSPNQQLAARRLAQFDLRRPAIVEPDAVDPGTASPCRAGVANESQGAAVRRETDAARAVAAAKEFGRGELGFLTGGSEVAQAHAPRTGAMALVSNHKHQPFASGGERHAFLAGVRDGTHELAGRQVVLGRRFFAAGQEKSLAVQRQLAGLPP